MKNKILIILLLALSPFLVKAQQTIYHQSPSEIMGKAMELYREAKYVSAANLFTQLEPLTEVHTDLRTEVLYYKALCSLQLDNGNAEEEIADFIKDHPSSIYCNSALFEQAVYQFEKKKYAATIKTLGSLNFAHLSNSNQIRFYYLRAYSYFEQEKMDLALVDFELIKDGESLYASPSAYYYGHIQYLKNNFEVALKEFEKLRKNPDFEKVIPFYISQIYYKQARYRDVVDFTVPLINKVTSDQQPELARILGDSYFHLSEFSNAIQYLDFFLSDKNNRGREENYMLGYCYYLTGEESKAISYLEIASKGKDLLAQNAYYHLADCYVITNDKNRARQAFEAASELDVDPKIKEDALFNFAKITYELSYSPFNETIRAFDKYVANYPDSERNDVAYDYLVSVYMSTNNFREALASIEKIKVKSIAVKKAYQRVAYLFALESFNNLDYAAAISGFDRSIDAGDFNKEYRALALFWKAEAFYRQNEFNKAINLLNTFFKASGASSLPEYRLAHYNQAYAYFQLKEYRHAKELFGKYLDLERELRSEKVADANNRMGDCYFMERDYDGATRYYRQSMAINLYDADYALYQNAICAGLKRENQAKIDALQLLLKNYPKSAYMDKALYELGRTYERINQPDRAIVLYKNLIAKHPQSIFLNKALVQLGLIYYNGNEFQTSIGYFKQVTNGSPGTPETKAALIGLKNCYVELNELDTYFAYTRELGPAALVSVSLQDSLSYQAAVKLYMARDKKSQQQFERYLQQFPNGSFILNAHFYLAELLFSNQENDGALARYEYVINQGNNSFTETALPKAAGLYYDSGKYQQALACFERLSSISNSQNNLLLARIGMMRCQYQLNSYAACTDAANLVLTTAKLSEIQKREANYKLAMSLMKLGNTDKALPVFTKLASETNSAEGAESKYWLSKILYDQQKFKASEDVIMDFIEKNSPHQYWLAKSFILLADIYSKNGDQFQAKHTLKSVLENYPDTEDGIMETARQQLKVIEEQEALETRNKEKPLEINIGGQKK